jgi:hypothetical protein
VLETSVSVRESRIPPLFGKDTGVVIMKSQPDRTIAASLCDEARLKECLVAVRAESCDGATKTYGS